MGKALIICSVVLLKDTCEYLQFLGSTGRDQVTQFEKRNGEKKKGKIHHRILVSFMETENKTDKSKTFCEFTC